MVYLDLSTRSSFLNVVLWVFFHCLAASVCWAQEELVEVGCNVVTVSGVPDDACLRGPCAENGCEAFAGDWLNGDYVRLDGVTNQMVDPLNQSRGQLPVYLNEATGLFLFYDSLYAYSLTWRGETEGWAIGESIGSVCTDDTGYCRCGNVPAACCTTGPQCTRYLAKQSSQMSGTACKGAKSYNRRPPQESGTAPWKLMAKECHGGERYATEWNVRGIRIRCKRGEDGAPVEVELKTRECRFGRRGMADTDCRANACQGCMYEYNAAGCQANVASCQCLATDGADTARKRKRERERVRLDDKDDEDREEEEEDKEEDVDHKDKDEDKEDEDKVKKKACTPCKRGRSGAYCSRNADCCSGKCWIACGICTRYKETCNVGGARGRRRGDDKERCAIPRESCSINADCCSNRCRRWTKTCA